MKQFKLPKEFAEKWVAALRSGEYTQGKGILQQFINSDWDGEEPSKETCSYCCLGVAGVINNINSDELSIEYYYHSIEGIPNEIIGDSDTNILVQILSNLNDGLNNSDYTRITENKYYIFREDNYQYFSRNSKDLKFNFNQIADFIEDNCEFYEN